MNCIGIDPGSNSIGLCYWIPGSALRFAVVHKSSSEKLTAVQKDIDLIERIEMALAQIIRNTQTIHLVVLEEPKDAQTHWSAGKGGPMAVGSLFAMGKGYGLCLAALDVLHRQRGNTFAELVTYQVKSNKYGEGWQPRFKIPRQPKGTPRAKGSPQKDMLLAQLRVEVFDQWSNVHLMPRELARETVASLSEHELMAYGVLAYHLLKRPR